MFNFPGLNLSENILSWTSELVPGFDFTELINGKVSTYYDLGTSADKFYSDISFFVPVTSSDNIKTWFSTNSGNSISMSSDIDIFFPDVYHSSGINVIPIKLTYEGLHLDNRSKHSRWTLRLFCNSEIYFNPQISTPSFFNNGLWSEIYIPTQAFQIGNTKNHSFISFPGIKENNWNVSFTYLSRPQMNELMRWWLTKRTDSVIIDLQTYIIKEIDYETNGIYYSANIALYK